MRRGSWPLIVILFSLCLAPAAGAQVLTGPWVDRAQKRIDKVRKTAVRVIVLDGRGNAVPGASVSIDQTRQAFALGFVLPANHWPRVSLDKPVWRCFSAVSLAPMTAWPDLQPKRNRQPVPPASLERILEQARQRAMQVRWGPMVSADVGQEPNWAARLSGRSLRRAVESYQGWVLTHYGRRVSQFDLFADTLDHPLSGRGFDPRALRSLVQRLKTRAPQATLCAAFSDGLLGARMQPAFAQAVRMQQAFVPLDAITLSAHFHARVLNLRLGQALHQWDQLNLPLIVRLEAGGHGPAEAKVNLETALRTIYADPNVIGITMSALTVGQADDPAAALLDAKGKPTASGQLFDAMFYNHWRTHLQVRADQLGDVRCRVFAGAYHITARIDAHTSAAATVWIPLRDHPQLIVIQPPVRPGKPAHK